MAVTELPCCQALGLDSGLEQSQVYPALHGV